MIGPTPGNSRKNIVSSGFRASRTQTSHFLHGSTNIYTPVKGSLLLLFHSWTQRQGRWCWLLLSLMKGLVSPKSCTLVRQRHRWFCLFHDNLKGSADNSVFKTLVGLTLAIYHMPTQATTELLLSLNSIGEEQNIEKLRSCDKDKKITYEVPTQAKWTWFGEN